MKTLLVLLGKAFLFFLIVGLLAGFLVGWFWARRHYRKMYHA
jgi:uncharacterized protein YneF (UPF0154 family)